MKKNIKKYEENFKPKDQAESLREMMRQKGQQNGPAEQTDRISDPLEYKNDQADELRKIMRDKEKSLHSKEPKRKIDLSRDDQAAVQIKQILEEMYQEAGLVAPGFDGKTTYIAGVRSENGECLVVLPGHQIERTAGYPLNSSLKQLLANEEKTSVEINTSPKKTIIYKTDIPW